MKKVSFLAIATLAMVSCSAKYEAKTVTLTNQNDSMNYALGYVNGDALRNQQNLAEADDLDATVAEFINAMDKAYKAEKEVLTQAEEVGKSIAFAAKGFEKSGLAENAAWTLNEKIFFQGLTNGILGDTTVMQQDAARDYFQNQYQLSHMKEQPATPAKAVKGKMNGKAKTVSLANENDSLNYAFGFLNGSQMRLYIFANDSTGDDFKEFVKMVNKTMKEKTQNPQLVAMAQQIGQSIKEQEAQGLLGEPSLQSDFELIKQGFVNGMYGFDEQMNGQDAGEYIQNTMNTIKYGDTKAKGEAFLAENALRSEVTVTESGLQYEVLKMGKGAKPKATDRVKVHYHGTLTDGTVFDSSVDRGEPITFGLNQVIPGWTEGVQLMPVGSKFRFYIPQELGYGAQQAGSIPPYSTLIFEVELLGIE